MIWDKDHLQPVCPRPLEADRPITISLILVSRDKIRQLSLIELWVGEYQMMRSWCDVTYFPTVTNALSRDKHVFLKTLDCFLQSKPFKTFMAKPFKAVCFGNNNSMRLQHQIMNIKKFFVTS